MNIKQTILPAVDAGLAVTAAGMNAVGRLTPWGYAQVPEFAVDGHAVRHFIHRYNTTRRYPPTSLAKPERILKLFNVDLLR